MFLLKLLLVVCLLHLSSSERLLVTANTPAEDFLDTLEQQVTRIAEKAVLNAAITCALVASCECSRGVCSPLIDDFNSYECVYLNNNTACLPNPGSSRQTCDGQRVQLEKGFVRIPTNNSSSPLSIEVRDAVCTQRMLDATFVEIRKNSTNLYGLYLALYFGSIDGSLRAYPGKVIQFDRCGGYDPRIRPWYVGSISVLKDIVVLLDTCPSMGDEWTVGNETVTRLASAKSLTLNLLSTLTKEDSVAIVTFNDSAVLGESYLVPDGGLDPDDTLYKELLLSIQSTAVTFPVGNSQSNITRALNRALSVYNNSRDGTLKIITLFTDGKSSANLEETLTVIEELKRRQIFLFLYQLGDMDDTLSAIACAAGGYSEGLTATVMHNPMYALKSYFSFLARSHQAVTSSPFWQPVYTDYDFLGQVISVASPAISANGRLVGVAGIDVQVAGLDPVLRQQVELSLIARSNFSFTNPPAKIEQCSSTYRTPADCGGNSSIPICEKTDYQHSFKSLVCCEECGGIPIKSSSSSRHKILVTTLAVGSVTVVALGVGVLICVRRWYQSAVHLLPPPRKPPLEFVGGDDIPSTPMTSGLGVQPADLRL